MAKIRYSVYNFFLNWALSVNIATFLTILPTLSSSNIYEHHAAISKTAWIFSHLKSQGKSYIKRELTDTKNINFIIYQVKKNSDTERGSGTRQRNDDYWLRKGYLICIHIYWKTSTHRGEWNVEKKLKGNPKNKQNTKEMESKKVK